MSDAMQAEADALAAIIDAGDTYAHWPRITVTLSSHAGWDGDGESARERADRRHPIAALVRHIDAGDVPIAWVMEHEARWAEIWGRARLMDRVKLTERVSRRAWLNADKWAARIAGGFKGGYYDSPYGNAIGWIYRRHIAAPSLAACIAAARAKR